MKDKTKFKIDGGNYMQKVEMDWISNNCKNKLFWHVTSKENVATIKTNGIKQSEDGQLGKGLYCIEAEDYDVLDSIIELMEQRGNNVNNLIIIEFKYSGPFIFCPKNLLINSNEGWHMINQDIELRQIQKIINLRDI